MIPEIVRNFRKKNFLKNYRILRQKNTQQKIIRYNTVNCHKSFYDTTNNQF